MALDNWIDVAGLRYFISPEQRGESFFIEVMEYDIMALAKQIVSDRMRDGVIQAVRVRVSKNDEYFHLYDLRYRWYAPNGGNRPPTENQCAQEHHDSLHAGSKGNFQQRILKPSDKNIVNHIDAV